MAEIFDFIFHHTEDVKSLLSCRLTCKTWKSAADKELIKRLTFIINDWHSFNDSTIVNQVKSIKFNTDFIVTEEESTNEWLQFCTRIGSTVEEINFDYYYKKDDDQQIQLINSLISSCVQLKENLSASFGHFTRTQV